MPQSPIHPDTDPELVVIGDKLKDLKERRFFGQFTIHFGNGIANQTTTLETHKLSGVAQPLLDMATHSDPGGRSKQMLLKPKKAKS